MKDGKNSHQFITTESNNDITTLRQIFVDRLKNAGMIRTPRVEAAFRAVPRHMFVPDTDRETAYQDAYIVTRWQGDTPISSCSQPSITAMMLEMLDLQPGQRILEIGAGTGYAAALMAHIVGETGKVITIDLDEDIVDSALIHLQAAGVNNVQIVGLRLWLALRELCYCELSVKGNAASTSTIPPLLRRTDTFIATTGLYEQSTWCLLGLGEDTTQTADRKRPFRLMIRRFGPDNTLAQRLQAQVIAWESAGRPLVWNTNKTMEHLQLRAYSLEAGCIPQAHEILLTRQWTQFVITPQLHRTG
jgi:hypothetical protein